jgi:tryptophan halogenase
MSAAADRAIRTIAVAGGGIVALSAAIAFARALPRTKVTIVALPRDPSALADRMPASLPSIHRFHAAIGLDESELVRTGAAVHRLGTLFQNWSGDGAPWIHAFGDYGEPVGSAAFHQLWARARKAGKAGPYHLYSTAAILAAAGKFVHPAQDPSSALPTFLHGLSLDPVRYRARLEAQADSLKIERTEGDLGGVEVGPEGAVAAILLADGRRVEADLYLDCAGPSAPLLSALDGRFEDWSESLPCDRLLLGAQTPGHRDPRPLDVVSAIPLGWLWRVPLPGGTLRALCHSAATPESDARGLFEDRAGVAEAESLSIRPGRRPQPWTRNVLALGDASLALDPLHGAGLHLAQMAILRALDLLPGRDCHPIELGEYVRLTGQETIRVRDFLALHYLRSGRTEGAFWQFASRGQPPDTLAHTLQQFESRGRLPFYEEESFTPHSWTAVMLGMGILPEAVDPVAAGVDADDAAAAMRRLAARLAELPARLPAYRDYLER